MSGDPARTIGRLGLGEPGHGRAEHPQEARVRASSPTNVFIVDPRRQAVDVGLAQRELIGAGDGQTERRPGMRDLVERHSERIGGLRRL